MRWEKGNDGERGEKEGGGGKRRGRSSRRGGEWESEGERISRPLSLLPPLFSWTVHFGLNCLAQPAL